MADEKQDRRAESETPFEAPEIGAFPLDDEEESSLLAFLREGNLNGSRRAAEAERSDPETTASTR